MKPLRIVGTALYALALALVLALAAGALSPVQAATALRAGSEVNVSRTPAATEKARLARLAYADGGVLRKVWLFAYGDGPAGRQDVYVRASFDDGTTWRDPVLLSRDAAGAATGGQAVTTRDGLTFVTDNDKPGLFAPPMTSGPRIVVAWNSGYCPADPAAGVSGAYASAVQGAGDLDADGTPDRAYHCIWVATTSDPALQAWDVQQLTTGERDAIGEVIAGSPDGRAVAMAWQEDPAGLQPGEAEGRGDGGTGATVSGGTNIWYAHANAPDGRLLRASITTLSDNLALGTSQPGASRPNLSMSGSTAVVAYEESACAGGSGGKCIVFHSFAYDQPDRVSGGTIVSDVSRSARRVRLALQGAAAAGGSPLRAVLLWRESTSLAPGAPADIVMRRGLADTVARPGSTGLRAADLLADAPQRMTDVARSGGNANAHRAILRSGMVGVAYDLTPDMQGAEPKRTATPTANYNLFFTRSTADGAAGSWSTPRDLSGLTSPDDTVVEPRLVATPATVVNPLTGRPEEGDTQDGDVIYVAYATERNRLSQDAGRVYVSRSVDQGASFEPFVPVSAATAGQSESQLRPAPDGRSAVVLWMAEQTPGDAQSKDAAYAVLLATALPDLSWQAAGVAIETGALRTLGLRLVNRGGGEARGVSMDVGVPAGLSIVGIGDPSTCRVIAPRVRCKAARLAAGAAIDVTITVSAADAGDHVLDASATGDWLDEDLANDRLNLTVSVTDPPVVPPPPAVDTDGGGGCTMSRAPRPFDPVFLSLVAFSAGFLLMPRRRRSRKASPD